MLIINDVSKSYNNKRAVKNVSLHVKPGEIFGIIGHNGAGKSTLIKMVVGILEPDNCRGTNQVAPNGATILVPQQPKKI